MAYIVNGSIVSDAEFETIKRREIDKFNKQFLHLKILFVVVISLSIIFLISYGVYDVRLYTYMYLSLAIVAL